MSRKRALTDEQERELEAWYSDYKRIGTVDGKCRELGISEDTLRDAIRRVRGEPLKAQRQQREQINIDRLLDDISRETVVSNPDDVAA